MTRADYIERLKIWGAPHFKPGEILANVYNKSLPPPKLWNNIVAPLFVANLLRARMARYEIDGLRVNAAYRPEGGASNSQHKHNRALDLDLLPSDVKRIPGLKNTYYREAVALWCELGGDTGDYPMGLGLYCGAKLKGGIRVHIDIGYRARTWQLSGKNYIKPPLARRLAAELNLTPPVAEDDHS